jgi:hypothetical protein
MSLDVIQQSTVCVFHGNLLGTKRDMLCSCFDYFWPKNARSDGNT